MEAIATTVLEGVAKAALHQLEDNKGDGKPSLAMEALSSLTQVTKEMLATTERSHTHSSSSSPSASPSPPPTHTHAHMHTHTHAHTHTTHTHTTTKHHHHAPHANHRGRMLKESSTRIIKLLALLAIESHGPFPMGGKRPRHRNKEEAKLAAAKQERLLTYVDSLSDVLALEDDSELRAMVEMACQDGGVVMVPSPAHSLSHTHTHPQQHHHDEYVVVRTVPELIDELLQEVRHSCPAPTDSAWLALIMKVLITYQVRANLYDARARASFKRLSQRLGQELLPWSEIVGIEAALAAEYSAMLSDSEADPPSCQSVTRYLKVAFAAVGGGALMMYTGSVAAPSIAASLLALCTAGGMGTATLSQLTSSTAAVLSYWGLSSDACISSFLAATGVGLTGYKMSVRTRGVTEFHFVPLHSSFPLDQRPTRPRSRSSRRRVCVSVNGGMEEDEEEDDEQEDMASSYGHDSFCGAHRSSSKGTEGLPVFICIPGWVEEDQDPRRVWGGATTMVATVAEVEAKGKEWEAEMIDAVEEESEEEEEEEEEGGIGESRFSESSWEELEVQTSGWWREVVPSGEEHVLIWETRMLGQLHKGMREFVWNEASRYAIDELIKHTALAGLTTAAALPMTVLDAARKLDNPWQMAVFHAQEAGHLLANVLLSRPQGSRPITLLGYSMGARVIFHCLEALYAKGEAGLGIVENAVLLGAPLGRNAEKWKVARAVVAGRLINGYSTRDWVLHFLFRSKAWELGLAGVSPVEEVGVENVDLTEMVPGHLLYPKCLPNIMQKLQLEGEGVRA